MYTCVCLYVVLLCIAYMFITYSFCMYNVYHIHIVCMNLFTTFIVSIFELYMKVSTDFQAVQLSLNLEFKIQLWSFCPNFLAGLFLQTRS